MYQNYAVSLILALTFVFYTISEFRNLLPVPFNLSHIITCIEINKLVYKILCVFNNP